MLKTVLARIHQKHRTMPYPKALPPLPDRLRGVPIIENKKCPENCSHCASVCPTRAISLQRTPSIDLGACLFCTECQQKCPQGSIRFTTNHQLCARNRKDLIIAQGALPAVEPLSRELLKIFGRSVKFRQVSAGGCNACEADINVLSTVGWDLGRFGIQVVASPRHADGLLVTGPVTENMKLALQKTYDALPAPKIVIAVGACAISGGVYRDSGAQHCGADAIIPVDLYIPGCPPHPLTILDGFLRLLKPLSAV